MSANALLITRALPTMMLACESSKGNPIVHLMTCLRFKGCLWAEQFTRRFRMSKPPINSYSNSLYSCCDEIVALNVNQYGGGYPGPECFKSITITVGGKTAQATIMDEVSRPQTMSLFY